MPNYSDFNSAEMTQALKFFPLVGIFIGAVTASVFSLSALLLPTDVALSLSILSSILLTGALHEDGLADTCDGLGGGRDAEHCLSIMQDSRLGSYGVLALVLALLIKFTVLQHFSPSQLPFILIAAHSSSRLLSMLLMYKLSYLRSHGKAQAFIMNLQTADLAWAAVFGLAPLLLMWPLTVAILPVLAIWWWFYRLLKRRLQGYTGDCLGAMQQLGEIAFYLAALTLGGNHY